ncbi:MAG: ComEC/Rec2 family competence protein, partial [Verrucomicrobiales bacterium]
MVFSIFRVGSKNPLLPLAAAAILGILAGDRVYPEIAPHLLGAAIVLLFAGFFFLGVARRSSFFLLALTALVFAFIHGLRLESQARFPLAGALEKYPVIDVVADGVVVDTPRPLSKEGRTRYPLQLLSIDDHRVRRETGHLLSVIHDGPPPEYGDRLRLYGRLRAPRRARNPHEFNLSAFMARSGVVGELRVRTTAPIPPLEKHQGNLLYRAALLSRDWVRGTITRGLGDSTEATVLAAMVLGERDGTPDAVETNFRHSGALHIFAVSGLHVGIFGGVLWMLLKALGVPRTRAVLLIIPCLLFYAYLTGLRPSAVRAAVMVSIYLLGFLVGRPPRLLNSLAAAALLILAVDSQQIFLPGFQLSFAVLAAIALLAPPIRRRLHRRIQPDPFIPPSLVPAATRRTVKAGRSIADLAAVSTAAWIGSAPLGLWHFHLVTPVALIANIFFVPLAFATLSIATMSLLSAGIGLGALSLLFNHLNGAIAKLLLLASAGFASLPGSHFYVDPFPSRQRETCRVTVLDTGLGGAAQLISVKHPRTRILVDCGGMDSFFEIVRPFLRGEGGARLDALVLTHGDAQHLGGAAPLMHPH